MKLKMAIFVLIILTIYSSISYYIFIRGLQTISESPVSKKWFIIVFIFLTLSPIIGKILENVWISQLSEIFVWIGSFWIAVFIYSFIIIVFLDLTRILNYFFSIYPSFITANYAKTKFLTACIAFGIIVFTLIIGYINAINPQIKTLNININKKVEGKKSINIVALSDIHLGTTINKQRTITLINQINKLKPDIVLIAGDIIDDNMELVKHYELLKYFKEIKSKHGVYAVTGNHEYISRAYKEAEYFKKNNIILIQDSVIEINNNLYIVGREDIMFDRNGKKRKTLKKLLLNVDINKPIILLDHEPYKLDDAVNNNIDFQLSGHTHSGQFWPINYITNAIFEINYGYKKKKETHFYISSGYGTSGPPIRIGNRPEIINIKLSFE